jgi:hypothetical protein
VGLVGGVLLWSSWSAPLGVARNPSLEQVPQPEFLPRWTLQVEVLQEAWTVSEGDRVWGRGSGKEGSTR